MSEFDDLINAERSGGRANLNPEKEGVADADQAQSVASLGNKSDVSAAPLDVPQVGVEEVGVPLGLDLASDDAGAVSSGVFKPPGSFDVPIDLGSAGLGLSIEDEDRDEGAEFVADSEAPLHLSAADTSIDDAVAGMSLDDELPVDVSAQPETLSSAPAPAPVVDEMAEQFVVPDLPVADVATSDVVSGASSVDVSPVDANLAVEDSQLDVSQVSDAAPVDGGPTEVLARNLRTGDELVERGIITKDQLNVALQEKKRSDGMLGAILVELGFLSQAVLLEFLAQKAGVGVFNLDDAEYDPEVLALFDKKVARKLKALPVKREGDDYYFAMVDPQDVMALDSVRRYLPRGVHMKILLASDNDLGRGIDAAYGYASLIKDILRELEEGEAIADLTDLDEKDMFSHPIVRLVNALVFEAVKMGVSDLHFEPEENFVRLRYRLDGVLFTAQTLHKQHWNGIAQRLKILAEMDIADKISPQDGRFGLEVAGREADFRVSSLPTVHGENIVLRVLDKSASIMPMEALGFSPENREKIRKAQSKPEGIVIVTGPTGSGKTTSLYSMLNEINDVQVNIQTLEDPVEYALPMIRQTHVREGVLEFADGIKALLRQDPDIIFIGEIRDKTTAEMALKAAMTGHQVYTSLHTNDSFGAIPRLLDLGLKPGMLSGAIVAIFAQRLGRRLCKHCKVKFIPNEEEKRLLGIKEGEPVPDMYRANEEGCSRCSNGYKGRVALVEILMLDNDLNDLIAENAALSELRRVARDKGFKTMADDGILKIKEGITDIDAVSKVVDLTKR